MSKLYTLVGIKAEYRGLSSLEQKQQLRIMYLLPLFLSTLFVKEGAACVDNAPFYQDRGWTDDPEAPNWVLSRRTGNTNLLLLMHNYTFTCTGQLTAWYYWWRINNAVRGCEVNYTLYVLRPPVDATNCGTTVVGSYLESQYMYSNRSIVSRNPVVADDVDKISVKKGDFIGLQISIGSKCDEFTEAWLRGIVAPNTVSLRRAEEHISPNLGCEIDKFSQLEDGLGFISALVVPTTAQTTILQTEHGPTSKDLKTTGSGSNKRTSAEPCVTAITPTKAAKFTETQFPGEKSKLMTNSGKADPTKPLATTRPREVSKGTKTYVEVSPCSTVSTQPMNTTNKIGEVSPGAEGIIELENMLLLVILGSLVVSGVMVGICFLGATIHLCRRKPHASANESREIEIPPSVVVGSQEEPAPEYDYILSSIQSAELPTEPNAAYNGHSPTIFTTHL